MTFVELQKQRIVLKKSDPVRSSVYSAIIDSAKKEAKKSNRDVEDADILLAAKRGVKSLVKAIKDVETSDEYKNLVAQKADTSSMDEYINKSNSEIAIYEEFLPKMADSEVVKSKIDEVVSSLPEDQRNSKSMGRVIGAVKKEFGDTVDMAMASKMIKEALA